MAVWQANPEVVALLNKVKEKHHHPRLYEANIAVCFNDSRPFDKDGGFNWGRVQKFSPLAKLWHPKDKQYDFLINICGDGWIDVLNDNQREAWLDLHLRRCQVHYEPIIVEENGKKHKLKDEWGRIQYTDSILRDEDGNPKWKVAKLDLPIFTDNVSIYGLWCRDLIEFLTVAKKKEVA